MALALRMGPLLVFQKDPGVAVGGKAPSLTVDSLVAANGERLSLFGQLEVEA